MLDFRKVACSVFLARFGQEEKVDGREVVGWEGRLPGRVGLELVWKQGMNHLEQLPLIHSSVTVNSNLAPR
jgi:hypothetical protein